MVQVARTISQRVEKLLAISRTRWEHLPQIEAEFGEWDPDEQEAFVVEWVVEDDRLHRLEELFAQGAMTEDQTARYDELKKLVAENRPIIECLADS